MSTTGKHFVSTNYNSNKPTHSKDGVYSFNFLFANWSKTIQLTNTDYGYLTFDITFSGDTVDHKSISFFDPNGSDISVGTSLDGLMSVSNIDGVNENIVTGTSMTFYVIVNADQLNKSSFISFSVAMGKKNTPPTSTGFQLTYECTPTPLYKYLTGLHVYSPYDAIGGTAKLKTYLYSKTQISSWTVGTKVYSFSSLNNPALPYYYGYGTKVYKVGGDFDRAYGTRTDYEIKKKLFGKAKIKSITVGPQSFFNGTNQTSPACVVPTMDGVGIIKEIFDVSSLSQPVSYRYYMGYDSTVKQNSNDNFFTAYSFSRQVQDPITGTMHAMEKITQGVISGYNTTWDPRLWPLALTPLGLPLLIPAGAASEAIATAGFAVLDYLLGPHAAVVISNIVTSLASVSWLPWLFAALAVAALLYAIFHTKTTKYVEPCKDFLHHFIDTPYIELGGVLYRDLGLSVVNNGYYCDGIYFYQQSGGVITSKEISSTNARIYDTPAEFEFRYSIACDDPTTITDWVKLIILPYTSGKPLPYCGGGTIYYNTGISQVVSGKSCCDLEVCETFTINIQSNTEFSCVSQLVADNKAQAKLDSAVSYANNQGDYSSSLPDEDIADLTTYFTHELKIEDNPTMVTIYHDKRTISTPIVGTTLYYDACGCTKVLDGYYAVSGITFYRTFFHTTNGSVDHIYYMTYSYSTTTTTFETLITTNKDYSSNWYIYGNSFERLKWIGYSYEREREFNPNSLYVVDTLRKGFIKTSTTHADFQIYNDFINPEYNEAFAGWYLPLIDWIENEPFYYDNNVSITLNIVEKCITTSGTTRGFYILPNDGVIERPTQTVVNLTILVFDMSSALTATYVVNTLPTETLTFIPFDSQVGQYEEISNIVISSINSPNPINKITYSIGGFSNCSNPPTPSITPTPTPTPTPGPIFFIGQSYGGGTVFEIDSSNPSYDIIRVTSDILNSGGILDWWDANSICLNYTGGGFTDWYLPSLDDLYLIRSIEQFYHPPMISPITLPARSYWSNHVYESGITPFKLYYAALLNLASTYDYWFINRNKNKGYVFAVRYVQIPK